MSIFGHSVGNLTPKLHHMTGRSPPIEPIRPIEVWPIPRNTSDRRESTRPTLAMGQEIGGKPMGLSDKRFTVTVYGRLTAESPLGTIDVSQSFASKAKAERFARAISWYLPRGMTNGGCVVAWVLVYALANGPTSGPPGVCYMSLDPGCVVVKDHMIPRGYHGAPKYLPYSTVSL